MWECDGPRSAPPRAGERRHPTATTPPPNGSLSNLCRSECSTYRIGNSRTPAPPRYPAEDRIGPIGRGKSSEQSPNQLPVTRLLQLCPLYVLLFAYASETR